MGPECSGIAAQQKPNPYPSGTKLPIDVDWQTKHKMVTKSASFD